MYWVRMSTTGIETLIKQDIPGITTLTSAELIIPIRKLDYGIYKLVFSSRMWDKSIADPNWTRKLPFFNEVFTYIKIKKSPLRVSLIHFVHFIFTLCICLLNL